jgi:hypothetical protein
MKRPEFCHWLPTYFLKLLPPLRGCHCRQGTRAQPPRAWLPKLALTKGVRQTLQLPGGAAPAPAPDPCSGVSGAYHCPLQILNVTKIRS